MIWLSEQLAEEDADGDRVAVEVGAAVTLVFLQLVAWWDLAMERADQTDEAAQR